MGSRQQRGHWRLVRPGTDGDWVTSPSLANLVRGCSPGLEGGSEGSGRPGPGGPGRGLNVAVR